MKKSGCFIIVLVVAIFGSMVLNLALVSALATRGSSPLSRVKVTKAKPFDEEILVAATGKCDHKIAVIPLEGVIGFGQSGSLGESMVDDFKAALEQAQNDDQIKAVILRVDSPGGEITASDVIYDAIKKFSEDKPVIVYFNSIGASGAYYAACGADWVMCNETTLTGSIGVIISTLNYKELFGKIGLQSVTFKSGKFKDMLSGTREMTPEETAYVQGLVMQSYGRFVGIVATARKLDEQVLRKGVADGRILSGTDAFAAKLVDQLGYIEDAYKKARELGEVPDAEIVLFKRTMSFEKFFSIFGESRAAKIEIEMPWRKVALEPGRVYLLPAFYAP